MSTTLTPPAPAAPTPPAGGPQPGSTGRTVAIVSIALGGVLVLGSLGWGALRAVAASAGSAEAHYSADARGIADLDVDVSGADVTVHFSATDEATLEVDGGWGADEWTLEREGDGLVLRSPHRPFQWLIPQSDRAVLELPESLRGELDAEFALSSGSLTADGEFGELDLQLNAGQLTVTGSAREVSTEVNAGNATLALADPRSIELSVNAGSVDAVFSGRAPDAVEVEVSAGSLDVTLPDTEYRLVSDVSLGELDNRLRTSTSGSQSITVSISAGEIVLRPGS